MQKQLHLNRKALSSIALILLLLISAIVGGVLSYLWAMGYYLSLKEKIPDRNSATIVSAVFVPQNVSTYNVTIMNPSFSPDEKIRVETIAFSLAGNSTLYAPRDTSPPLPFDVYRGASQTFMCAASPRWSAFVNRTVLVSVFVSNGTGSTMAVKLPYTKLNIANVDFNPLRGVKNFTVTLKNNPSSATYLNITGISLDTTSMNNYTLPGLPSNKLGAGENVTFTCNYDWLLYARSGGPHTITVYTQQGYIEELGVNIPKLAFSVQELKFDPSDTAHFVVKVENQVSTNTTLNVKNIKILLENGTIKDVTPSLNSSTNNVPGTGSRIANFNCAWNWTNYRNKSITATVTMHQGVNASGPFPLQFTPPAVILNMSSPVFSDSQHFLLTVKNSQYSLKTANVTRITVTLENGTERNVAIMQPLSKPYLIGKGETTMFGCLWNWENYPNKTINIYVYSDEGSVGSRLGVKTPVSISGYQVYLNITSAAFNTSNPTLFNVTVHNSASSIQNASIPLTGIRMLLENGTIVDATCVSLPSILPMDSTMTFACELISSAGPNKNVVILMYTDEGLRAIYKTRTPP